MMAENETTPDDAAKRPLRLSIGAWLDRLLPRRHTGTRSLFRLLVASILGVIGAYGSILFRYVIRLGNRLAFPSGASLARLHETPWYRIVLPPAIGGLIVGPLVRFLAHEAKGPGVSEVKDACDNKGGRIRPRVAFVKILASGICIGSGGSVGREGPIVQIGSAVGSFLGQFLGIKGQYLRDLVASGAAASIASTFNAPIAGVVFCLEIILGRTSARHFSPLIVSSVVATVVARHYLGSAPAFQVPPYALVSAWELPLYVVLGLLAALVGVAFTRGLYAIEDVWEWMPAPPYLRAMLGGAVVGVVAVWLPQVLGVGYEWIEQVLHANSDQSSQAFSEAGILALLIAAKIFCTCTTIGSGGSGGVFAPSLFLGASLGGLFGRMATVVMPAGKTASTGAYALVAMGAVVAATTHAPMTSILIVFELTDNHTIILPLMLSCIVSTIVAIRLCRESIYTLKLVRRGAHVGGSDREAAMMLGTRVETLMEPVAATVRPDAKLLSIAEQSATYGHTSVYVTDRENTLLGVVTMEDLASHLPDKEHVRRKLVVTDVMHLPAGSLRADETLAHSVELFSKRDVDDLPVVDNNGQLIGRVTRADLISYYGREVLRQEVAFGFVDEKEHEEALQTLRLHAGEVRGQIPIEGFFVGKSLRELNLRSRFGINVYAIQHGDREADVPDPDTPLVEGDTLIVIGPEREIEHVRELALDRKTEE